MSLIYWTRVELPNPDTTKEGPREVNEQHSLPVGIYWKGSGSEEAAEVEEGHPLPVKSEGRTSIVGTVVEIAPITVPGIVAAVAYAANDQMGSVFSFPVPIHGSILEARFHDLDDEGLNKELWLFKATPTLAADNAAFSIADADNLQVVAVFLFSTWRHGVNNQVGLTSNTPANYVTAAGRLYGAVKTLGVDNIAAGSEPQLSFVIERYND